LKTEILKTNIDWTEIKNECRHTDNKEDSDKEASTKFIKQLLLAEHSPLRLGQIKWRWSSIKSWISVHFARHHEGIEKFVSTQRDDRTGVDRDKSPQDTPVNMDLVANLQALINIGRFRLCRQAHPETRAYMEDLKDTITNEVQKEIGDVIVPNCIYRCGCPEFKECGYFTAFKNWCYQNDKDITEIQSRYDAYNEFYHRKEN